MKLFFCLLLILSFSVYGETLKRHLPLADVGHCAVPIDFKRIEEGLTRIEKREVFGVVPGIAGYSVTPSDEPLPAMVNDLIKRISMTAFGRPDVVKVFSCTKCEAQWDMMKMSVGISPSLIKWFKTYLKESEIEDAMAFTLSHEVGHYLQNIFLREFYTTPPYLSETSHRLDFTLAFTSGPLFLTTVAAQDHAEVDGIAFVLLDRMGISKEPGIKMLRQIKLEVDKNLGWKEKKDVAAMADSNQKSVMMQTDARIRLKSATEPQLIDSTRCFE